VGPLSAPTQPEIPEIIPPPAMQRRRQIELTAREFGRWFPAQSFQELQNRVRFRLNDRFHDQLPCSVQNRYRYGFFVNIHSDILPVVHKALLSWR